MARRDATDGRAQRAPSRRARGYGALLPLVAAPLVLAADLTSKAAARSGLGPGEAVQVVGDLVRLRLGSNSGIAFGLLTDGSGALVWLTALVAVALVVWLVASVRDGFDWRRTLPLGLIIGGAFGNVLDRAPDGLVTDFIDVGIGAARWPSFNAADSAIVVGVLGLIILGATARTDADPVKSAQ